jgi:hypothetical protein
LYLLLSPGVEHGGGRFHTGGVRGGEGGGCVVTGEGVRVLRSRSGEGARIWERWKVAEQWRIRGV